MNRRDAIKALGAIAGSGAAAKFLTACGGDEDAGIDTLVFLMMENRSYDHYLGARALEGLPGNGLTAGLSNPDLEGNDVAIYPADMSAMQQCVVDPPHGWSASRTQLGGGANDGFLIAHQQRHGLGAVEAMQYMTRETVPVHWALADAYTSCDNWFCSVLGPTLPNRMYWHAGTSNGATDNDTVLGGAYEGIPTLYHNLDAAGVEWAYYYGDAPVLGVLDIPTDGRLKRFMYDFIDDAAAGVLPPVVYVDPAFGANDDHPPHHPLLGQQLIAATYQALATSPQWERCMLVITYDENGGFYDHVAPPAGAADEFAADGFDQLGFRVPTIVAGPYARQGYVSSVQYDHTSALKHVENAFGLAPLTMRSTAANDLMDTIDLERLAAGDPAPPIELPAVEIDQSSLPDQCIGGGFRKYDHDILEWADANRQKLGDLYLDRELPDYVHGIGEYLDHHNLGRIRRGK